MMDSFWIAATNWFSSFWVSDSFIHVFTDRRREPCTLFASWEAAVLHIRLVSFKHSLYRNVASYKPISNEWTTIRSQFLQRREFVCRLHLTEMGPSPSPAPTCNATSGAHQDFLAYFHFLIRTVRNTFFCFAVSKHHRDCFRLVVASFVRAINILSLAWLNVRSSSSTWSIQTLSLWEDSHPTATMLDLLMDQAVGGERSTFHCQNRNSSANMRFWKPCEVSTLVDRVLGQYIKCQVQTNLW